MCCTLRGALGYVAATRMCEEEKDENGNRPLKSVRERSRMVAMCISMAVITTYAIHFGSSRCV